MKMIVMIAVLSCNLVTRAQEIQQVKITDLEKIIAESKKPMVINFWATWCLPCIQEIPHFQAVVDRYRKDSVGLLLVSLDMKEDLDKLRPFAIRRKFTAPIVWLDETNADYFCPRIDARWSGAIPATLLVNNETKYRKFFEQPLKEEELEKEIMAILGKD